MVSKGEGILSFSTCSLAFKLAVGGTMLTYCGKLAVVSPLNMNRKEQLNEFNRVQLETIKYFKFEMIFMFYLYGTGCVHCPLRKMN